MTAPAEFITVNEICASLQVSKSVVYRWLSEIDPSKPFLPSYKIGPLRRIDRRDWNKFLRDHDYRGAA